MKVTLVVTLVGNVVLTLDDVEYADAKIYAADVRRGFFEGQSTGSLESRPDPDGTNRSCRIFRLRDVIAVGWNTP